MHRFLPFLVVAPEVALAHHGPVHAETGLPFVLVVAAVAAIAWFARHDRITTQP